MRDVARPVDERAGGRRDCFAADPERQLALRDVEPLVLVVVDVQRRSQALGPEMLDYGHAAVGCRARGLDRDEKAEEPARLALTGLERDRCDGRDRGGAHHSSSRYIGDTLHSESTERTTEAVTKLSAHILDSP